MTKTPIVCCGALIECNNNYFIVVLCYILERRQVQVHLLGHSAHAW